MNLQIADSHNDLLMAVYHLRERGHIDPFGDFWLPQLRAGNVALQVLPIYTEEQFAGEAALRRCLLLLEEAYRLAEVHSQDVALVLTTRDLQEALATGRVALVLAIEGAEPVGADLSVIGTLFRLGIRMSSMTWNRRTMLGDGVGESDTGGKLTGLGIDSVREMERLGMVLDVSHLSEAGFWHVTEIARRPFVASHSSARAVHDHPRNLTDAQLRAIADSGGYVGINGFGSFIADNPTLEAFLDHLSHAVSVIGPGNVGLGPDFILDVQTTVDPILTGVMANSPSLPLIPNFLRPADYPLLSEAMIKRFGQPLSEQLAFQSISDFLLANLPS